MMTLNNNLVGYLRFILDSYGEDEVRCRFVLRPLGEIAWVLKSTCGLSIGSSLVFSRLCGMMRRIDISGSTGCPLDLESGLCI